MDAGHEFVKRVRSGERVRCALIAAPGGYGKSQLAEQVCTDLALSEITSTVLAGDLDSTLDATAAGTAPDVVVLDGADLASSALLNECRREILRPESSRSFLFLARNASTSPELAELAAVADRDDVLWQLYPLEIEQIESRVPYGDDVSLSAADIAELTGAIPLFADRLCTGWDSEGWPTSFAAAADALPERFVTSVALQLGRLSAPDRLEMAERSLARLGGIEPTNVRAARGLIEAGIATADGAIPFAVAYAARDSLSETEIAAAAATAGTALLQTDPETAVGLLEGSGTPPSWTAVALASSGQIDSAKKALDQILATSEPDGAALAAAAHVAAIDARWGEASRLIGQIDDHPYWSDARTEVVQNLYRLLDLSDGPLIDLPLSEQDLPTEPGASFLAGAIAAMAMTMGDEHDAAELGDRLRELVRQSESQQPMLDVVLGGSELAALAALVNSDFGVAASLIERSPESTGRSALSSALGQWISMRSGIESDAPESHVEGGANDFLPGVLNLASRVMATRRSSDAAQQSEVLSSIVELGSILSVDLVTFDALCELHLGAHRVDARREARQIADGLDDFVRRLGSPLLWEVRLRWNQLEAAVAAGDGAAVRAAATELTQLDGAESVAPALVSAASEWSAVFAGKSAGDSLRSALSLLETEGYLWEAASLAGQAAIRTEDAALAKELLQRGREFRQATPDAKPTSPAGLSEREIEIGQLVLAGHSYKEIGATCFISPKTVEHHIAHIRQKLSAVGVSRAEFRASLEADLAH